MNAIAFSGGKDSTALVLWLQDQNIPAQAIFCDTGWEHPLTYAYIEEINQQFLGGSLVRLKPDEWVPKNTTEKYADMRDLVRRKGRVPSAKARFCTEYLKTNAQRAWIAAQADEVTLYLGIRAEESPARARALTRDWSDHYDCWIERPLLRWSAVEVLAYLERHGISANPLYKLGAGRVGCFPCIQVNHGELRRLTETCPEVWDRIAELESLAGRTFFAPGFIPWRHCSGRDEKTGKRFPTAADVRRYVVEADATQLSMLDTGPRSCVSVYNVCE